MIVSNANFVNESGCERCFWVGVQRARERAHAREIDRYGSHPAIRNRALENPARIGPKNQSRKTKR